ncbi:hypothetical protein PR048_002221 [Dryococelus australis]|uniref:Uncharacterized protein n=1 Tax=Dryococelus australis TaxID=614101 RepID=A0ABQ9IL50_9NEOP|nr:hypothetical protein PR048_002221 [Dryococelus australis]
MWKNFWTHTTQHEAVKDRWKDDHSNSDKQVTARPCDITPQQSKNKKVIGQQSKIQDTCALCMYTGHHTKDCDQFLNQAIELNTGIAARFHRFQNKFGMRLHKLRIHSEFDTGRGTQEEHTNTAQGYNDERLPARLLNHHTKENTCRRTQVFKQSLLKTLMPRVLIKLKGTQYYALLDIGCSRSCIAKKFSLVSATNEREAPKFKTNLKFTISGNTFMQ